MCLCVSVGMALRVVRTLNFPCSRRDQMPYLGPVTSERSKVTSVSITEPGVVVMLVVRSSVRVLPYLALSASVSSLSKGRASQPPLDLLKWLVAASALVSDETRTN